MAEGARVESIEALERFRVALVKFTEAVEIALADADGQVSRTGVWLETEMINHWQTQIRKRHDLLERAKEALRMKKLFKDASGRTPSAVEEEKAVRLAMQKLETAHQKLESTRRAIKLLQRESQLYKGGVQRLLTALADTVPNGVAALSSHQQQLRAYVGFGPTELGSEAANPRSTRPGEASTGGDSMKRAEPTDDPTVEPPAQTDSPSPPAEQSSQDSSKPLTTD